MRYGLVSFITLTVWLTYPFVPQYRGKYKISEKFPHLISHWQLSNKRGTPHLIAGLDKLKA